MTLNQLVSWYYQELWGFLDYCEYLVDTGGSWATHQDWTLDLLDYLEASILQYAY